MIRLFLAINLPDEARAHLAGLCSGLPEARWVARDNLHITLRFIGAVDEDFFRDILDEMGQIRGHPFMLQVKGLDVFGPPKFPRALLASVVPSEPLSALQVKMETALVKMGLPPEARKFKPHVTLARLKSPSPRLGDYLSGNALFECAPFRVEEFTLYSSHETRGGMLYRAEALYPLLEAAPAP